ncbi:MAG: hypothetical protein AAGI30_03145 [Planctomycetota bacterium]
MTTRTAAALAAALATGLVATGCSDYRASGGAGTAHQLELERTALRQEADRVLAIFRRESPVVDVFLERAHGYAIFPRVTRGAAGVGAAHGRGVVYETGALAGYAELYQATLGVQLGGQSFHQLIFFEHADVMRDFKRGDYQLSANASAVAVDQGEVVGNDFRQGVAVFTIAESGLMFEASVGGQRFEFTPVFR